VSTSPIFSSHQNPGQKPFCNFKKRRKNCGEEEKETERKRFLYKVMLAFILVTTDLAKRHSRKERERERERETLLVSPLESFGSTVKYLLVQSKCCMTAVQQGRNERCNKIRKKGKKSHDRMTS
jgi:hypothetical protein